MKHRYLTIWLTYCNGWYCFTFLCSRDQYEFTFSDLGFPSLCPSVDLSLTAIHARSVQLVGRFVSLLLALFLAGQCLRCAPSWSHAVGNPTVSCGVEWELARAAIRQSVRLCLVHWPKAFVDHSFFLLSEVCVCSFGLLFPFGIVGPIAVCVSFLFTCNRTGHWQPGSLAGVAHLLERNTDVPRTAP